MDSWQNDSQMYDKNLEPKEGVPTMNSRRSFMKKILVGASACAVTGLVTDASASIPNSKTSEGLESAPEQIDDAYGLPQGQPPWALIQPLVKNDGLGRGWRIADLSPVRAGAAVITLRHRMGQEARVHLCRNDGHPCGMTHSDSVDLLVMNGGSGFLPTDSDLGVALLRLRAAIEVNESSREGRLLVAALSPHDVRLREAGGDKEGLLR